MQPDSQTTEWAAGVRGGEQAFSGDSRLDAIDLAASGWRCPMPGRGCRHGRWSREKMLSSHGYVKVRVGKDHPLADPNGYAYEHLLVWVAAGNPRPDSRRDDSSTAAPGTGGPMLDLRPRNALGDVVEHGARPLTVTEAEDVPGLAQSYVGVERAVSLILFLVVLLLGWVSRC